ncbi:hypothetical protein LCGC14_0574450 [marine sediment metagenome]|uniref:Alpha-D-phosphohexomutase alpha/beta/alpha domain-containing protein n=1 Tax=marine sediment metagenome TaxID=412755 RepID=A0A0F9URJ1_9ZZZZ
MIEFEIEDIHLEMLQDGVKLLNLPDLTQEEKNIIDPIVSPTSGLRIQLLDKKDEGDKEKYILTKRKLFLFFRVFKAISQKFKDMRKNENLKILIFTDNRPTKDLLLKYCSQIFAYDGYEIIYQKDDAGKSRISAPYGAASLALYNDINLAIVLTASHNDLSWNGIKVYIDYPIPLSGEIFKDISKRALEYKTLSFKPFIPSLIDAEEKNNEYTKKLLSKVIEIKSLKGRNIVIWPYLGKARGIVKLFKEYGANVTLIDEEINPPNPIKIIHEEKLQKVMDQARSSIALLLDADRDRIALYVKQNGKYFTYIPNEIYSAMHNILAEEFKKNILNVRTIPSDLRGDHTSFLNVLTGVGYKHLGVILYFLFGIGVDQSKIDLAILYMEDKNDDLIKINNPTPLKERIIELMKERGLIEEKFLVAMWEESGGHTLNILEVTQEGENYKFETNLPLIADKYPVPALVLITELICRGYNISDSINWSIKGINRTTHAIDSEKVRLMTNFLIHDKDTIQISDKKYNVQGLSDNTEKVDIYQLKSSDSTLYFRPSGTGPDIRFYIFGRRETHLDEIQKVMGYIGKNFK